jgi:hypothetical protein
VELVRFFKYLKMKYALLLGLVFALTCCRKSAGARDLEGHIRLNRVAIQRFVQEFESSRYKKVSFGSPDFLTLVDYSGEVRESVVDEALLRNIPQGKVSKFESDVLRYFDQFKSTGIRSLEKSGGIYVEFSEGLLLIAPERTDEDIERLGHGKKLIEVYPGWYMFVK